MILKLSNTYRLVMSLRTKTKYQASSSNAAQIPKHRTACPHPLYQLLCQSLNSSVSKVISELDCMEFGHPIINPKGRRLANNSVVPCMYCTLYRKNVFSPNRSAPSGAGCHDLRHQAKQHSLSPQRLSRNPTPLLCFQGKAQEK